ncbi:MAG: ATPase [Betaproteobacteria bacterium]|nr:ATPase [Betaproteobacteria bacterium]
MDLGLGLDVGGTRCRWALADSRGQVLQEGSTGSFNGQQVHTEEGRHHIAQQLGAVRQAVDKVMAQAGRAHTLQAWAGVTGYDGQAGEGLQAHLAQCLGLQPGHLRLYNDVELAHRVSLARAGGYLVYAGTGCIATYLDEQDRLHRVGGRGETLGDDGSGYWIGCQALKAIWRAEDESPGYTRDSQLAQALFQAVGGSAWEDTRRFMHLASRGDVGRLALAVAAVADRDAVAQRLLQQAGQELARLARLLMAQHGQRAVWLAGGAFELHPLLPSSLAACLPTHTVVNRLTIAAHRGAAARAAGAAAIDPSQLS